MPLHSDALASDQRLEACLVEDSAHLTEGVQGEFVAKVQAAIIFLDELSIDENELAAQTYGPSTASAVLKFKTKRKIINRSYQNQEDNIVGKMTIKAIDDELAIADQGGPTITFIAVCPDRIA
jgi:hypothetical protein